MTGSMTELLTAESEERALAIERRVRRGVGKRLCDRMRLDGSRLLAPPWGLEGGEPGGRGDFRLGAGVEPFVNGAGSLRAGQTVEIVTPGPGGYGQPAERDPAVVESDLAEGRIDAPPRL